MADVAPAIAWLIDVGQLVVDLSQMYSMVPEPPVGAVTLVSMVGVCAVQTVCEPPMLPAEVTLLHVATVDTQKSSTYKHPSVPSFQKKAEQ